MRRGEKDPTRWMNEWTMLYDEFVEVRHDVVILVRYANSAELAAYPEVKDPELYAKFVGEGYVSSECAEEMA